MEINKQLLIFGVIYLIIIVGFSGCIEDNIKKPMNGIKENIIIQQLINDASLGDIVNIPSGIYYETIVINKSLSLIGENKENTIIHGNGNSNVVKINADNVTLTGFTLENSGNISRCVNFCGIYINSTICNITDNIAKDNQQGIKIIGTIEWQINDVGNTVGIFLNQYHNVYNNILTNNSEGIVIAGGGRNNSIYSNDIFDNDMGILLYVDRGNNNVFNNLIYENKIGIKLTYSKNNNIFKNSILNNSNFGINSSDINPDDYNNNTIYKNNFIGNGQNAASGAGNIWYNNITKQGNYWDDYTGVDEDSNGISDTAYNIGINIQDLYPFIDPIDI